jgi:hypothetical protein
MPAEDVGVEPLLVSAANRLDEIGEVVGLEVVAGAREALHQLAVGIEPRAAAGGHGDVAFAPGEDGAAGKVETRGVQAAHFLDKGRVTEVVDNDLCVGRLGGVGVAVAAVVAHDRPGQFLHAQAEARQVGPVDVAVAQVAVARLPEPVPIVVEVAPRDGAHRGGAGPEVVIDPLGHLSLDRGPDGTAALVRDAPRQGDPTKPAFGHELGGGLACSIGPILGAHLADAAVLPRRLHDAAALAHVVPDRLLQVHVLARLHRPDRRQRVPVVARGDRHAVDRLVVDDLAQVLVRRHLTALLLRHGIGQPAGTAEVSIAHGHHVAIAPAGEAPRMDRAANARANHRDRQPFVGAGGARRFRPRQTHQRRPGQRRGGRQDGMFQKLSPCEHG